MRLVKVKGITFISASDTIDLIRDVEKGKYKELADAIAQLVFDAELKLEFTNNLEEE